MSKTIVQQNLHLKILYPEEIEAKSVNVFKNRINKNFDSFH